MGVGEVEGGQHLLLHRGHALARLGGGPGQGADLGQELAVGRAAPAQGGARGVHAGAWEAIREPACCASWARSATVVPRDRNDWPASLSGP